jgi:hypothetical protein
MMRHASYCSGRNEHNSAELACYSLGDDEGTFCWGKLLFLWVWFKFSFQRLTSRSIANNIFACRK